MERLTPFIYVGPIEFDAKDERINIELQKNARAPISILSKHTHLSRDIVGYRINQLMKNGWIQNFIPVININKLGLHWYTMLLKLENPPKEIEQKLKEYFIREKYVRWAQKCAGLWDTIIHVNAPSILQLNKILTNVRYICRDHLRDYELLQGIKEWKYNNFITGYLRHIKKEAKDISAGFPFGRFDETESIEKLDEKDIIILNKLIENARMPLIEIAHAAGLSSDATALRIKSLQKKGVIRGFATITNTPMQGCELYIVLFQLRNLTEDNKKKLIEFLRNHPFICNVAEFQGKYDLWVHIWPRNAGHFNEILTGIRTQFIDLIRDYDVLIGVGEYKFGNPYIE
jgi:Lrp/AsnC family leucine-responsive transcriptional regulator